MILRFAWRYFKAKKSANAINIIAWVTTCVISFATCCQILVLSVFNGFEGMVTSLYATFYSDIKIVPDAGKTFLITPVQIKKLRNLPTVENISFIAQEKALLQNGDYQSVVILKGVDSNYAKITGVASNIIEGSYQLGSNEQPRLVVGAGVQNAAGIQLSEVSPPDLLTVILPKVHSNSTDPIASLAEGNIITSGVFAIQQEFDNQYAIAPLQFVKDQMGFKSEEFTAVELKIKPGNQIDEVAESIKKMLGTGYKVQTRYQQNMSLYTTMRLEKWAIYAVLTLILIIAAFNMISSLTMLVLEKQKDISILQSLGAGNSLIKKIFLGEGLLLGCIGAGTGMLLATLIALAQLKWKFIKLQGNSFLIDYFPIRLIWKDYLIVALTSMLIVVIASWLPSSKAAKQPITFN